MLSLKRKNEYSEIEGNKVMRLSESVLLDVDVSNSRNFAFKLTDATAKKNLIAGARRIAFEVEPKQKSTKLKFSAGAYLEVVIPTLLEWKNLLGNTFHYGDLSIKVFEVKAGYEEHLKHFDTKIIFLFGKNRVVIHSYNSTQNMKIEGKGYIDFIEKYLEPYFLQRIKKVESRINEYNKKVVGNLAKPAVRRSTIYKPA